MRLAEKNAIVTGGAHGIGASIALLAAREGANIVVADIDIEGAEKISSQVREMGGHAIALKVDVTRMEEASRMAEKALQEFKTIDILINNAGGSARGKASFFWEMEEETWNFVLALSLKSAFHCTRAIIGHMIRNRKGKIINMSSAAGLVGFPRWVDYSAAKAGIIGFTMALAKEVAPFGIHVNAVAPGPIATAGVLDLPPDKFDIAKLKQFSGLNRLGTPEEVAAIFIFLASEEANFITGQVIPVCGLGNLGV
jgi:NAD(P)-dependent dehydrogenase (short-subunit alcohol dehydrogenase family)